MPMMKNNFNQTPVFCLEHMLHNELKQILFDIHNKSSSTSEVSSFYTETVKSDVDYLNYVYHFLV